MAARPQVTITLGRSGQVVKRAGPTVDGSQSDYATSQSLGSKRPLRERLGGNAEDPHTFANQFRSKRAKSYSAWPLDGRRHRSPDRLIGVSRGPSNHDELRHVSSRSVDTSTRSSMYTSKDLLDASRPVPFMTKSSVPIEAPKPVLRAPPPGGVIQKSSHMPEEPITVAGLLHSLGLGKYAILFQVEEVDMAALKQMSDNDLKELGIPMGPRKKILLAVLSRPKRHP
ncbi:hypothetical protein J5N97_005101 [Dioscorea zingiberensis]|uniref:SAM domain-containing protein n=1 Tax=Dioscorea zingiberensis TaxID=325984 RepID=A0A9D5HRK5_9LILI|nr:hypothetical protein J5N97_005101 [Dioscorea zingiberensis]